MILNDDLLNKYKSELLPYFLQKIQKTILHWLEPMILTFKKMNTKFDKVVSLFDVWTISMDDKKGQWGNRMEGGYIRQIFVYNEKDKNFHSLKLGFSDQFTQNIGLKNSTDIQTSYNQGK